MRSLPLLATVCLGLSSAHADLAPQRPSEAKGFDPAPFSFRREIALPSEGPGLFRIEADASLHRHAGGDFGALRMVRFHGEKPVERPWVLRKVHVPKPSRGANHLLHRVESFEENSDGSIEVTVSLEAGTAPAARLEIETPLRDFEKSVTVSIPSGEDGWQELVGDRVVFDHSRFLDFRRTAVELPGTSSRRFRIRIAEATDEQRSLVRQITRTLGESEGLTVSESGSVATRVFRIDGLRFLTAPVKGERGEKGRRTHDLAVLETGEEENGTGVFILDAGHLPFDRLLLVTDDRNFRRAVSVQIPTEGGAWHTVHRGHAHRYQVGDFHDESLALSFPEIRAGHLRLLVENGNNPPVAISGVTGRGPVYEIVFLAEAGEAPLLYLGLETAEAVKPRPALDTAAIEAALHREVEAKTATLGGLAENPLFAPAAKEVVEGGLLDSQPALWGIIALAVAVLVWVLYRSLLRIEGERDGGG